MKKMVDAAKHSGFSEASWSPLAALVAVDEFERVGSFLEVTIYEFNTGGKLRHLDIYLQMKPIPAEMLKSIV